MALTSPTKGMLEANDQLCDILGYDRGELLHMTWAELTYPEDLAADTRVFNQVMAGEIDGYSLDKRFIRKDGRIVDTTISVKCLRRPDGSVDYFVALVQDITNRKRNEARLQRRTAELHALQATLLDIAQSHALPELLNLIVERACNLMTATNGGLYLCDPKRQEVRCVVSYKTPHDYTGTVLKYGVGAAGVVAQTGQPLIINDYRTWASRADVYEADQPFVYVLSTPMKWHGQIIGVIHVVRDDELQPFTTDDLELLGLFANHAAVAAEYARTYTSLQQELVIRRQVEEELRESQSLYRSLVEVSPLSICRKDLAGRFTFANQRFLEESKITRAGLIGKTDFDLHPPNLAEKYRRDDQAVMDSRQVQELVEERALTGGESIIVQTIKTPIYDGAGNANGVQISFWDITARKHAEDALHESEVKFRAIIEQAAEGVVLVDERGSVIEWNRAQEEISGISRAEAIGQPAWSVQIRQVPLAHRAQVAAGTLKQTVLKMLETGQSPQFEKPVEIVLETLAGERKTILQTSFPIKTDRGYRLCSMVTDITTRKRMEDALVRRAQELIALHQTALQINTQSDLMTLLHTIVERQAELTDAQGSSVYLVEPNGQTVRKVVTLRAEGQIDVVLPLGEGIAGRVAQTGQPVMIADYSAWEERPAVYTNTTARRALGVPLRVGQRVIGALTVVDHRQTGPFTDETVQLVSLFADQAALAIENARLLEAEHTQRQLAEALRDSAAALNSTLTLNDVFDRILANVERIVPHEAAHIMLIEDEIGHIVRHRGFVEHGVEHLMATAYFRVEDVPNMRYMQTTGQPLAIPDVRSYPGWVNTPEVHWVRSHVAAPLRIKSQVVGFLNLDSSIPDFYTPLHAERLLAFADQAALAVENARLFEAARTRLHELDTVYTASRQLTQSLEVTAVLDAILSAVLQLTSAGNVQIFLYDGERLSFGSAMNEHGQTTAPFSEPRPQGLTYTVARSGETIFVADTLHHPRFNAGAAFDPPQLAIAAFALKFEATVVGVMNVTYGQLHVFAEAEQRVLNLLATQAATAIQNARLHRQVRDHAQHLEQRVAERTAELQTANVRLTELDHLKDEFLSRISHELRTPLSGILLALELLDTAKPEKRERYMQRVKQSAHRMRDMVEDVLMFSELYRYTQPDMLTPSNLNDVIEGRLTTWQKLSASPELQFKLDLTRDLPHVRTDSELIGQALHRLVINAINYTPAGSVIVSTALRAESDQSWITIRVQDTGPGITPDDLPHIFERFYRGRSAADYKTPGTGIGLSISREIAEKLGGRLTVETEVGVGSTFTLWLPMAG